MKRISGADIAASNQAPKRQSRQDPVSCELCRKKKLKCDRGLPCNSCCTRRTECNYGSYRSGVSNSVPPQSQTEERPLLDRVSEQPRTLRWNPRQDAYPQARNRNEPLQTADRLESIVMGHRVPTAVPATLRAELSHRRDVEHSVSQHTTPSSQFGMAQGLKIASSENPATVHLPSFLPPLAEVMGLFRYYCDYLDFQYHLIIPHIVEQQIQKIYDSVAQNEQIDLAQTALLFSIVASSLYYQLLGEASGHAEQVSQEATFLAGSALIQGNYIAYPSIEGLQATMIIGHQLSNMNLPPSVSSLFVHRSFVSQATSMRLHLVDSPHFINERTSTQADTTNVELKRRLWWDLATYDWLISFLSGPQEWTYSIQPEHMVVQEPLNIEDEDIDHIQTSLPLSTPTKMSYSLCRSKLAVVCRHIVDETSFYHLHGQEVPYDKILALDRKLHNICAEIPNFFRFDQASRREYSTLYRDRPTLAWQRSLVQQGYHSRLCRLHRHYFVRGAKDPRYSYSHVVSLQSARKVLEIKRMMDEDEPVFNPHSSVIWAVMHHVFMAAVILLIDVCFNWDDILAERRKEEVLDACRMLSRAQQSSPIAREGITAMMGILRKHWKHERWPSSRGLQPEHPVSSSTATAAALRQDLLTPDSMGATTDAPPCAPDESSLDASAALLPSPLPLEDMWAQMLDSSAHIELDTPDWTDLLTELTNATLPSE